MASIYGSACHKDGSKADETMTVGNLWNGNKVYPKNGKYCLDLGRAPLNKE